MTSSQHVVAEFIAAVEAKDIDRALGYLAEDVSYENVPMDPIVGRELTGVVLRGFLEPATEVDWQVSREIVAGNVVVNERVDRFRIGETWVEVPVVGVWEINQDGRITLWRDYFDMETYTSQLSALTDTG